MRRDLITAVQCGIGIDAAKRMMREPTIHELAADLRETLAAIPRVPALPQPTKRVGKPWRELKHGEKMRRLWKSKKYRSITCKAMAERRKRDWEQGAEWTKRALEGLAKARANRKAKREN